MSSEASATRPIRWRRRAAADSQPCVVWADSPDMAQEREVAVVLDAQADGTEIRHSPRSRI
jgi:hypothetical protein